MRLILMSFLLASCSSIPVEEIKSKCSIPMVEADIPMVKFIFEVECIA
jgi:hypothetical protein